MRTAAVVLILVLASVPVALAESDSRGGACVHVPPPERPPDAVGNAAGTLATAYANLTGLDAARIHTRVSSAYHVADVVVLKVQMGLVYGPWSTTTEHETDFVMQGDRANCTRENQHPWRITWALASARTHLGTAITLETWAEA